MEPAYKQSFGELLREYRRQAGFTQEELAERAELSVRGLKYLESDERRPHGGTIRRIADALALTDAERSRLLSAAAEREQLDEGAEGRRGLAAAEGPRRSFLPAPATPLIGRQRDVVEAVHRLRWGGVRLLTLIGPGGVGKTRVAIAVARDLLQDFLDGLTYVSLAPVRDPRLVGPSIAAALGLKEPPGQSVDDLLLSYLRERSTLLVLDNIEHLLGAAPLLASLLEGCEQLKLLLTSRVAMNLYGEHRLEIAPLEVPDRDQLSNLEAVARYPAVELFTQRAQAARRGFALTESNAGAVVEICRRLDGLPLAIELAAARIASLPPQALLMRLDQRLRLLTEGPIDRPDRQQTMRNTIAWSYHLLDEPTQRLFRQLSVFAGGWGLEGAAAVTDGDGDTPMDLLRRLGALVDSSLLMVEENDERQPRYSMLETIREYAAEELLAQGEAIKLQSAHAAWYLALAETAAAEMTGPGLEAWLRRLDPELDNLRAALGSLLERGQVEEELRLAIALFSYWNRRGYWSEGVRWLQAGIKRERPVAAGVRAQALGRSGGLLLSRGDHEPARPLLEEALRLAKELGDRRESAWALRNLGRSMALRGEVAEAIRCLEASLHLCREEGDLFGIASGLDWLGIIADDSGDFVTAESHFRESLALYREVGDISGVALSLNNIGYVLMEQGKTAEAGPLLEESLALTRRLGFKGDLATVLDSLGCVARAHGDLAGASAYFVEGLAVSRELEDTALLLVILGHLAELAVDDDRAELAARLAGAETAARAATKTALTPIEQKHREQALRRARQELGDDEFNRLWEIGRAMSLDEAVAYALDSSREIS